MFEFGDKESRAEAHKKCLVCKYLDFDTKKCIVRYSVVHGEDNKCSCGSFKLGNPEEISIIKCIENKNW